MNEQQLQFRVGLFVVVAALVGVGLAVRFGELRWLWQKNYSLSVHFDNAPGIGKGVPVRKSGVVIGSVKSVKFDEERGGILAIVDINEQHSVRTDCRAQLVRSILGDASLEISPGRSPNVHKPGDLIEAEAVLDPTEMIANLERKMSTTLSSFEETSREWQKVAVNINNLTETHRGNLDQVVERAAESLHQFTLVMKNANQMLGDQENIENLRATLAALPQMVEETRLTVRTVRGAVAKMDATMGNLRDVTEPLAQRSASIAAKLDSSIGNLEKLLAELNVFTRMVNQEEGSLKLFATDPQLYRNLNSAASTLQTLIKNLDPAVKDLRVFTDKVARHPELIGVRGALSGSSGVK